MCLMGALIAVFWDLILCPFHYLLAQPFNHVSYSPYSHLSPLNVPCSHTQLLILNLIVNVMSPCLSHLFVIRSGY